MNRLLQFLSLSLLAWQLPSMAQIGDLTQIKERREHLDVVSDELMSSRVRLLAQTDSIDHLVDSLRQADPESSGLLQARVASHQLVVRLESIDMFLDSVRVHRDSLDQSLRDAYDWEISRLQRMLRAAFDEGLYQQLTVYQAERHDLGLRILRAPLRDFAGDDARLTLSDDDGPMELQMKAQLAQDQMVHYRQECERIDGLLVRLDRDAQLAGQMWQVAQQFMQLRERNQQMMRELAPTIPSGSQGVTASDQISVRPVGVPEVEGHTPPPVRTILLQITQLKTRRQELQEIEAIWQERLGVFHRRLQEMLDPPISEGLTEQAPDSAVPAAPMTGP